MTSKNNKDLISVIVPVYNVKDYLNKCIDSILNQTYTNIELILVDDGSKDESGKICDEYAKVDDRVIVIHQKNQGISSARNAGINNCHGDYIGFVDSDDFLDKEMYEDLYNNLKEFDSDISVCNFYYYNNGKTKLAANSTVESFVSVEKQKFENLYNDYKCLGVLIWNKLFKREIFETIRFEDGKNCEDNRIICPLLDKAKKVSYILKPLYYYVYRKSSLSNNYFIKCFPDVIESKDIMISFLESKGYYDLSAKEKNVKILNTIDGLIIMKLYHLNDNEYIKKYYDLLIKETKSLKWDEANKKIKRFKLFGNLYILFRSTKFLILKIKK